jgi:hypothetical protein
VVAFIVQQRMSVATQHGAATPLVPNVVDAPAPREYEVATLEPGGIKLVWSAARHVPLCESSKSRFHRAVDANDPLRMQELLAESNEGIDAVDMYGFTALHCTAFCAKRGADFGRAEPERVAMCKMLVEAGADLDVRGQFGQTVLQLACVAPTPQDKMIEFLVSRGASLLQLDDYGATAAHCAAMGGRASAVEKLTQHPDFAAALHIADGEGFTPKQRAADPKKTKEYCDPFRWRCIRLLDPASPPFDPAREGDGPSGALADIEAAERAAKGGKAKAKGGGKPPGAAS